MVHQQQLIRRTTWWAEGLFSQEAMRSQVGSRLLETQNTTIAETAGCPKMSSLCRVLYTVMGGYVPLTIIGQFDMMEKDDVQALLAGHATAGIGRKDLGGADTSAYAQQQQQHHGTAHPGKSCAQCGLSLRRTITACLPT